MTNHSCHFGGFASGSLNVASGGRIAALKRQSESSKLAEVNNRRAERERRIAPVILHIGEAAVVAVGDADDLEDD